MSIIHIQQIKSQVTTLFKELIDLSDYKDKKPEEAESAFLSRGVLAFAISAIADIQPARAANCITDGFHDNGIDAVFFDDNEKVLYIGQSKWHHDGNGSIERGDAQKFIKGITDLVNVRFDRFNDKVKRHSTEIQSALELANIKIVLLVVHTGQSTLSADVTRDFDDLLKEMNDTEEVMELRVIRQVNLHNIVANGVSGTPINFDLVLKDWGQIREPSLAYFGRIAVADVADWWEKHHPRLFVQNIRAFLGTSDINQGIIDTLLGEPENFWYFNNGITALCDSIKKKPIGGNSHDSGVFECTNVSIVNGAQTVGAIATAYSRNPEAISKATVMVRFISLENCPDDFAERITRATNTQNRIEKRDFVSLDAEQERFRTELQLEGVDYVYKAGYTPSDSKMGFDLTEATVVLACSHPDLSYAMQAKKGIGVLWEDVTKSPYKALFNASVSSIKLWKLVQIFRHIDEVLRSYQMEHKGRDAMLPVHGNRFLARQVFRKLPLVSLDDPRVDIKPIIEVVPSTTTRVIQLTMDAANLKYPESYLANLFKNNKKCLDLEGTIDSKW